MTDLQKEIISQFPSYLEKLNVKELEYTPIGEEEDF